MSDKLLELQNIDKSFPGVKALDCVNLSVYAGKVMALVGENGAGKSTLMKVITGIYKRDAGDIYYLGKKVNFKSPRESQNAGISIIHQELNLLPELSIAENIYLGREKTGKFGNILWSKMFADADSLLQKLNVNYSSRTRLGNLSIGEQQMVEIAKALSFDSKVIIMDEPTDALTDKETSALFKVVKELRDEGKGIVYISHRLKEIFEICDYATVFRDGKFIAENSVQDINEDELIEMMVGRKLEDQYPKVQVKKGDVSLHIENLVADGVKKVSLKVHDGEILGISGLMGSGRTELVKAVFGSNKILSGSLKLHGKGLAIENPKQALMSGIAYISEDRKADGLVLNLSVKHNMSMCALRLFSSLSGHIQRTKEKTAVDKFISAFNIKTPTRSQKVGNLSGGNQQKVAIAKGLMIKPQVLILDEPTRGVDVGAKKEIYQLINKFKQEGMSIILISSDMPEVLGMSDRIVIMHEGRISGEFSAAEADQEKLMACAVGRNYAEN